jgi:hypothetical protein
MKTTGVRRSGRIAKEVPIVLIGTDERGRVFSENTTTVVLSRHGAGLFSWSRFTPDEMIVVRLESSGREAQARLIGCIGETERGRVYGVEFLDPSLDFWEIEFPPPETFYTVPLVWLECSTCHQRRQVEQSEVETDVFLATDEVFRSCEHCGLTTSWHKASDQPSLEEATGGDGAKREQKVLEAGAQPASPSGTVPAKTTDAAPKNRRKHLRLKVSFNACVRYRNLKEEIVECENVSKGGLCFRASAQYPQGAQIEVAAPYEKDQQAIFVPAQIRYVEEVPEFKQRRYRVAYLKTS